jgi:dienelactone hydrolase
MALFAELKRRHVVRVGIAYCVIAWAIAQVAEFAFETFAAPDWVLKTVVIILLLGLPVAVFLAWAFEITPEGVKREKDLQQADSDGREHEQDANSAGAKANSRQTEITSHKSRPRRIWLAVVSLIVLLGAYLAYDHWQAGQQRQQSITRLSAVQELTAQDRYGEAFVIANELRDSIGDAPEFLSLWEEITAIIEPRIADTGVQVSFKPYEAPESKWIDLGTSPLAPAAAPMGVLLLRLEKPGFESREFVVANPGPMLDNMQAIFEAVFSAPFPSMELYPAGEVPEGMVRIPATDYPIYLQGFSRNIFGDARYIIPSFAIDRSEVSNREYKAFVDDDGYSDPSYWSGVKGPDGKPLDAATIATFVDASGRPGPSNWELGNYPSGASDLPVGGISLYEAKAYARYRKLALPTIHHWARAAFAPAEAIMQTAPAVARASNFEREHPLPVSSETGKGPWGTVHTAGNAREWVWNETGDLALALGGAWSDYTAIYEDAYTISPLDRSPQNGMRLMHTLGEPLEPTLLEPVTTRRDGELVHKDPVSDEVFEAMRFQFTHARRSPSSVQLETVTQNDTWIAEEVVLNFGSEQQATLYVIKPAEAKARLQPVLYMPHSGARQKIPNRELLTHVPYLDFIVRAGRALIIPIWEGTAQRYTPWPTDPAEEADHMRRKALAWYEDAATVIDYLETREDIDASHIGYIGNSYGSIFAPILLATEKRFSAAVLISGGSASGEDFHPMYDPDNYTPRVTIPVLMINGRYDHVFLYEDSQKRMFDLLGTPAEHKHHLIFDKGHFDFPRNQVAREVADWFDLYLASHSE